MFVALNQLLCPEWVFEMQVFFLEKKKWIFFNSCRIYTSKEKQEQKRVCRSTILPNMTSKLKRQEKKTITRNKFHKSDWKQSRKNERILLLFFTIHALSLHIDIQYNTNSMPTIYTKCRTIFRDMMTNMTSCRAMSLSVFHSLNVYTFDDNTKVHSVPDCHILSQQFINKNKIWPPTD